MPKENRPTSDQIDLRPVESNQSQYYLYSNKREELVEIHKAYVLNRQFR